ncbi:hypothetical protein GPZ88_10230 (plasmid) [Streptococcus ruminicola]|uniref:Uncharacterized protein n=1 Tax=Streptococcus ruminicola TaxID=2686210 RepID=A0A6G8I2Q1_9STRE|nr:MULTISPECIES: hypothetical protein [Streptococcus]QGX47395.1 hypothetical protein GPA00_09685 [Streptococcus equinus]QIM47443.1 hypothetical protein GPZ88_10230 [Streptococcus ruminicola]
MKKCLNFSINHKQLEELLENGEVVITSSELPYDDKKLHIFIEDPFVEHNTTNYLIVSQAALRILKKEKSFPLYMRLGSELIEGKMILEN